MAAGKRYRVIVTAPARLRYQQDTFPYLIRNFSAARVLEIEDSIQNAIESLEHLPSRGSLEPYLCDYPEKVRFILFRETSHFELKILYHIVEEEYLVRITDFFPTAMHPTRMKPAGSK